MVTVKEIANLAGVSPSTVSLVLNGRGGVGEETRRKVLELANSVGYVHKPKRTAMYRKGRGTKGSIRLIKYKNEGLLVDGNGDFISKVIDGVADAALSYDMNLNITNVGSLNFREMIDSINDEADDGIIFLGTELPENQAELLQLLRAPFVVIDNEMPNAQMDAVVMNNHQAVFLAMRYLSSLGHTKIGHIRSCCRIENFRARDCGYHKAMESLGLKEDERFTVDISPDIDLSYHMMLDYLNALEELPTAFFADNDVLAIGALRAFRQKGIKVPDEISVVGMDDLMMSAVSEPKLTTIKIFKRQMGALAVQRIMEKLAHQEGAHYKMLVGAQLIVRESAGKFIHN